MTDIPADILEIANAIENKYTNYDGPGVDEIAAAIWIERQRNRAIINRMIDVFEFWGHMSGDTPAAKLDAVVAEARAFLDT